MVLSKDLYTSSSNAINMECPECEKDYTKLGMHITKSECSPKISDGQYDILTGLLLGDGTLHDTGRNPAIYANNTNEKFLEWVSDELGWLTGGVSIHQTGEELQEYNSKLNGFAGETKDQYIVRTVSHSGLDLYRDWYNPDKTFPESIRVNPVQTSVWYCCDGTLNSGRPKISIANERGNQEKMKRIFSDCPAEPSISGKSLYFNKGEDDKFFSWIKGPLPGFEYKWTETFK